MALLVANSEAVKCVVKGDLATANLLAQPTRPLESIIEFKMSVKFQEECDGMCIYGTISGNGEKKEVAGCQEMSEMSEKKNVVFLAMNIMAQSESFDYNFFGCNADNCNAVDHPNHATMMNIQKSVNDQAATLNKPRSADLKCHNENGVSEACSGICFISHLPTESKSSCGATDGSSAVQGQVTVISEATEGAPSKSIIRIACTSDNCNAAGSVGEHAVQSIQSKLDAELATVQFVDITSNDLETGEQGIQSKVEAESATVQSVPNVTILAASKEEESQANSNDLETTTKSGKNTSHGFVLALVVSIIWITVAF